MCNYLQSNYVEIEYNYKYWSLNKNHRCLCTKNYKERCPSGLRCRPGTSVWGLNSTKGSNPFLSATLNLDTLYQVLIFYQKLLLKTKNLRHYKQVKNQTFSQS